MSMTLQQYLFNRCGGFRDKRVKNLQRSHPFQIDNRKRWDVAHDFCDVSVILPDPGEDAFDLELTHVPHNDDVLKLVEKRGGHFSTGPFWPVISIRLDAHQGNIVKRLAKAIRGVAVGRRKEYPPEHRNWAFTADRTATALERFAETLGDYLVVSAAQAAGPVAGQADDLFAILAAVNAGQSATAPPAVQRSRK